MYWLLYDRDLRHERIMFVESFFGRYVLFRRYF